MEGSGEDVKIWKTVNEIARIAHKEDPNHPTMTVVAEVGGPKLAMFRRALPGCRYPWDQLLRWLERRWAKGSIRRSFERPYVVTEFGPAGAWEVGTHCLEGAD